MGKVLIFFLRIFKVNFLKIDEIGIIETLSKELVLRLKRQPSFQQLRSLSCTVYTVYCTVNEYFQECNKLQYSLTVIKSHLHHHIHHPGHPVHPLRPLEVRPIV